MGIRARDDVKEILNYIHKNIKKGYKPELLKWALIKQGYSRTAIADAFEILKESSAKEAKEKEKAEIPRVIEDLPVTHKKKGFWRRIFG